MTETQSSIVKFRSHADEVSPGEALDILKSHEMRLRLALKAGRLGTFEYDPQTGAATWDEGAYDVWGLDPETAVSYELVYQSIHADDKAAFIKDVEASMDPEGPGRHDIIYRIHSPQDGQIKWIHAEGDVTFLDGLPVNMVGTVKDVSTEQRAKAQAKLMADELDHRIKNLFSVVIGIATLTARTAATPQDMAAALRERLHAMAIAHELIRPQIDEEEHGPLARPPSMDALLSTVLEPHANGSEVRISYEGDDLRLSSVAATNLALVIHEFATNAAKYGCLSTPAGSLNLRWAIDKSDHTIRLDWVERGGPRVSAPTKQGFGSALINATLGGVLSGTLRSDWSPEGVSHHLRLPRNALETDMDRL